MEEQGSGWSELAATEKKDYLGFHENAYREDIAHAEKNLLEFPRWSIISGYYAMHDATKLFLAKRFNVKIAAGHAHENAIRAVEAFVKDASVKERILSLLKKAEVSYYDTARFREKILPALLRKGRQERSRSQYYTAHYKEDPITAQRAAYFMDTVVRPYLQLVEGLVEE